MIPYELVDVHPEVAAALGEYRPVVALESSIISYGAAWPKNVEFALELEGEVRRHGAVPATCAIIDGRIKVGLNSSETDRLGQMGRKAPKVSRRDIAILVATGGTGSTTIAATMIIANLAGIRVCSAGGLGGVHRGAAESFDVSADLQALASTPVALVCAGIKSILDVRLTMEYLETYGIPVIGFGTDTLPGFYSRDSEFLVDVRLDDPHQIAKVMKANGVLGIPNGIVIANPIREQYSLSKELVDHAIEQALRCAREEGVTGKAVTPFLISRISEISGRISSANLEIGLNNAQLAAAIALAYSQI